jgi:BirA family biotin operon repressor/biotin-[acetyl-CoA-carboxylase] ligase
MLPHALAASLSGLSLGGVRYYERLGSTNDEAAAWAQAGAPDMALVVAGEQTAGRGRAGRKWFSPPSSGLAFSLVLRLSESERGDTVLPRLAALGALAVASALESSYGLPARVKWPNDVLVAQRKLAGVLAEAHWTGAELAAMILGIGINVAPDALDAASRQDAPLRFPATSVESVLGRPVDPWDLLGAVLEMLFEWRARLPYPEFLLAWEEKLAFRGEWVQIALGECQGNADPASRPGGVAPLFQEGQILGLAPDGCLRLRTRAGDIVSVRAGEVRLLPVQVEG